MKKEREKGREKEKEGGRMRGEGEERFRVIHLLLADSIRTNFRIWRNYRPLIDVRDFPVAICMNTSIARVGAVKMHLSQEMFVAEILLSSRDEANDNDIVILCVTRILFFFWPSIAKFRFVSGMRPNFTKLALQRFGICNIHRWNVGERT